MIICRITYDLLRPSILSYSFTHSSDVNKGIVVATLGYWRQLNNGTVNSISSNAFGDMGNSPTSHDCLVEVQSL